MEAATALGDDADDRARRGVEQPRLDQDRVHRRVEERVIGDVVEMPVRVVVVPAGGQRHEAGESGAARRRGARLGSGFARAAQPTLPRGSQTARGDRQRRGEQRLGQRRRGERNDADRPGLAGAEHRRQPGETGGENDEMAERHRGDREQPAARPAALGEPADQRRGEEKADQIAAGRPDEIGGPGGGAGEHRQADQAFAEIERDRRRGEAGAEQGAERQHRERLQRHRHRIERNLDLGRDDEDERAQQTPARRRGRRAPAGFAVGTNVAFGRSVMQVLSRGRRRRFLSGGIAFGVGSRYRQARRGEQAARRLAGTDLWLSRRTTCRPRRGRKAAERPDAAQRARAPDRSPPTPRRSPSPAPASTSSARARLRSSIPVRPTRPISTRCWRRSPASASRASSSPTAIATTPPARRC